MNKAHTSRFNCAVPECHSKGTDPEVSIYLFPKNRKLRDLWQAATKIDKPITRAITVCNKHFVKSDFFTGLGLATRAKDQHSRLKRNVVPSRNLPGTVNNVESSTISLSDKKDLLSNPLPIDKPQLELDPALSRDENIPIIGNKDLPSNAVAIDEPSLEQDLALSGEPGDENIPITGIREIVVELMPVDVPPVPPPIESDSSSLLDQNMPLTDNKCMQTTNSTPDEPPLELDSGLSGDQSIPMSTDVKDTFVDEPSELLPIKIDSDLPLAQTMPLADNEGMSEPMCIDETPPIEPDPTVFEDQNIPLADNKLLSSEAVPANEPPLITEHDSASLLTQNIPLLGNEEMISEPLPADEPSATAVPVPATSINKNIPLTGDEGMNFEPIPADEPSAIPVPDPVAAVDQNIPLTGDEGTISETIPADEPSAIKVPDPDASVNENIPIIDKLSEPMPDEPSSIDRDPSGSENQTILTSSPSHLPKIILIDQQSQTDPFKGPIPVNFMDNLVAYDYQLICFTGISRQTVEIFTKAVCEYTKLEASPLITKKVISAMVKLKTNLSFQCLSVLFHQGLTTCKIDFAETVSVLGAALKPFVYWPSKRDVYAGMPICFNKHNNTGVMLECIEIFIERSKNVGKVKTYSARYKRDISIKFLVAFTPAGLVSYVSPAYGGKNSEETIFLKENLLAKLDPFDAIMVDDGFYVEEDCDRKSVVVLRAPVVTEKMSKQERELVEEYENMKVHVTKTLENMRLFNVFSCRISKDLVPCMSDVAVIIGAAVNVELKQKKVF